MPGWTRWERPTPLWCWTPVPPTGPSGSFRPGGRWSIRRRSTPGGSTQPATSPLPWFPPTPTSASAPTWTNGLNPAGGQSWKPPGPPARPRRSTAIPGTSTPTARKGGCSGLTKSTRGRISAGNTRSTRCCAIPEAPPAGPFPPKESSSTTTPTPPNPGHSTCLFWSWGPENAPTTPAPFTIWGGNTSFGGSGKNASRPLSGIWPCPPPAGPKNAAPPCGISPGPGCKRAAGTRPGAGGSAPSAKRPGCGSPGWTWPPCSVRKKTGRGCSI